MLVMNFFQWMDALHYIFTNFLIRDLVWEGLKQWKLDSWLYKRSEKIDDLVFISICLSYVFSGNKNKSTDSDLTKLLWEFDRYFEISVKYSHRFVIYTSSILVNGENLTEVDSNHFFGRREKKVSHYFKNLKFDHYFKNR